MVRRGWLRRLERSAKGNLESFELTDGTRFYFDPLRAYSDLLVFQHAFLRGEDPDLPEVFLRLEEAVDPAAALDALRPAREDLAPTVIEDVFDVDTLIRDRRLVVLEQAPVEDLSE